jgi:hypothetical protein
MGNDCLSLVQKTVNWHFFKYRKTICVFMGIIAVCYFYVLCKHLGGIEAEFRNDKPGN